MFASCLEAKCYKYMCTGYLATILGFDIEGAIEELITASFGEIKDGG